MSYVCRAVGKSAWTSHTRPKSISYGPYTFVGAIDESGNVSVLRHDHRSGLWESSAVLATSAADDHNHPAVLVRSSDQRLIVAWSGHTAATVYWAISTDPLGIAFGDTATLTGAADTYSYAQLIELTAEGKIFLFTRNEWDWRACVSTDNGATFTQDKSLWHTGGQGTTVASPYSHPVGNGVDTIWFTRSDWMTDPGDSYVRMHVMCAYYKAGAIYTPTGTLISAWADLPILDRDLLYKIYDSTGAPDTSRYAFNCDIALGSDGWPVVAFTTLDADYHNYAHYARFNGATWTVTELLDIGADLYPAEDRTQPAYNGGMCLDHSDPSIVYLGREVGAHGTKAFRIEKWQTADGGTTFTSEIVSNPSQPAKVFRPIVPLGHQRGIELLVLGGTYTAYTTYNLSVYAYKFGPDRVTSAATPPAFRLVRGL